MLKLILKFIYFPLFASLIINFYMNMKTKFSKTNFTDVKSTL